MGKDYKIEMKPTLWSVSLETGSYSGWEINYLFFRANDKDEVWNFLCRYIESIYEKGGWIDYKALTTHDGRKYCVPEYLEERKRQGYEEGEEDWNSRNGEVHLVKISRLHVIEFQK